MNDAAYQFVWFGAAGTRGRGEWNGSGFQIIEKRRANIT